MQTAAGEQKNDDCRDGRERVACRDSPPNAVDGVHKERRHPEHERYQIEHLAREAEEDRFAGFADRGKEVTRHHLETDDEH